MPETSCAPLTAEWMREPGSPEEWILVRGYHVLARVKAIPGGRFHWAAYGSGFAQEGIGDLEKCKTAAAEAAERF